MIMDIILITRLKELRDEFGWTQKQLADRAGLSQGGIGAIENGSREPNITTLKAIARAFGVGVDYLIGFDDFKQALNFSKDLKYDERALIDFYRILTPSNKEMIFRVLQSVTLNKKNMPMEQITEAIYAN